MTTVALIPCGGEKLDHAAPAADLYTSSSFRLALAAAHDIDDDVTVYVLSAKHGLVTLDTTLEPYDVKMGDTDAVTADVLAEQIEYLGLDTADVYGLLPSRYFTVADAAFRTAGSYISDIYEVNAGIGDQRHICKTITNPNPTTEGDPR